jgi:protease YdgD
LRPSKPRLRLLPAADRLRPALVLAAALLALATPAAADDRSNEDWPWSAVGRVLTDGTGPCSGVLIEPRIVLTVGHCVAGGSPWRAQPVGRLSVALAGTSYAVGNVRIAEQSPFAPDGAIGDLRHDWALLELAAPPPIDPVPYRGTAAARRALALDNPVFKVGWRGQDLKREVACTILEIEPDGRLLAFRCPGGAGEGRSGSALLVRSGRSWEAVAVQSGEAQNAFTAIGLAVFAPVAKR